MDHDPILYGRIQGFLRALEMADNAFLSNGEFTEFAFSLIPPASSLARGGALYQTAEVRKANGHIWIGKPQLTEMPTWETEVEQDASRLTVCLGSSLPTEEHARIRNAFVILLHDFFGSSVKAYRLTWLNQAGHPDYPYSVAFPVDFVFDADGEWFHLGMVNSD